MSPSFICGWKTFLPNRFSKKKCAGRVSAAVVPEAKPKNFYEEVAAKTPTPGGGSVAAAAGAMGAALDAMVCRLTIGKKKYKEVQEDMERLRDRAEELRLELQEMIIKDGLAFDGLITARRMPKDFDHEIEARNKAMLEATKKAAEVPPADREAVASGDGTGPRDRREGECQFGFGCRGGGPDGPGGYRRGHLQC